MKKAAWITEGFEGFSGGTVGDAGYNLYVSKRGALQRIQRFDLTGNGYVDLFFNNSQSHWEQAKTLVYDDPLGKCGVTELPSHGAWAGAVADLNGDGFDDLILGFRSDGAHTFQSAFIYYGSEEGLSEKYHIRIPAPMCTALSAGDYNGDGKIDAVFLVKDNLRVFYQTSSGFEMKAYTDLEITGEQLASADIDGDGYDDLVVRQTTGEIDVYWGGAEGIDPDRRTAVPVGDTASGGTDEEDPELISEEHVADAPSLVKVIGLNGDKYVFAARPSRVELIPAGNGRTFDESMTFRVPRAYSVAVGDINGDGMKDIAFACRDTSRSGESTSSDSPGRETSWIYWGGENGFSEDRRTPVDSWKACDVDVGDLTGDGCCDVLICQNRTAESFTTESLIYRGTTEGVDPEPVRLLSHDARRGFIARPGPDDRPRVILTANFGDSASDNLESYIYFGDSDGYRPDNRQVIPGWGAYSALAADLNDDGYADLVVANGAEFSPENSPGSFIFYGTRKGIPAVPDHNLPSDRAASVLCADLNRDGYLDLVFSGAANPNILVYYGGPDGFDPDNTAVIHAEGPGGKLTSYGGLFLADLDLNGWLDLIAVDWSSGRSFILWGGAEGFSIDRRLDLAVWKGRSIQAADLTGNGYLDLVIGAHKPQDSGPHDSFVSIFWNGPEGIRNDRRMMLQCKSANGLAVGDFKGDGNLDIFVGSYGDGRERDLESYIYWNRQGKGFSEYDRQCLQTHAVAGCLVADFNEDGKIDLAVANHKVLGDHRGYSEVWWNGSDGFDPKNTTRLPTKGARGPSICSPGNVRDRGPEELYMSAACQLPAGAALESIEWKADIPAKTWVKAQLRTAHSEEKLAESEWRGPDGEDSWFESGDRIGGPGSKGSAEDQAGSWVQYRLTLGAVNSVASPKVTEVRVNYEEK